MNLLPFACSVYSIRTPLLYVVSRASLYPPRYGYYAIADCVIAVARRVGAGARDYVVSTLYSLLTGMPKFMPKLPAIKLLLALLHIVSAQDHLVFHQHATRHTLYLVWFQNLITGLQTSANNLY